MYVTGPDCNCGTALRYRGRNILVNGELPNAVGLGHNRQFKQIIVLVATRAGVAAPFGVDVATLRRALRAI